MKTQPTHAILKQVGMTLIELLIVVAIVGILSAIAIPSYNVYITQSKRADAKAALAENAQFLERHFASNGFYSTAKGNNVAPALPVTTLPRNGGTSTYSITAAVTNTTYTLTATPENSMAGDECGNLTLAHTGAQGVGSSTVDACWNK